MATITELAYLRAAEIAALKRQQQLDDLAADLVNLLIGMTEIRCQGLSEEDRSNLPLDHVKRALGEIVGYLFDEIRDTANEAAKEATGLRQLAEQGE